MSSQPPFGDPEGPPPTEEEMRAAYEAQLKQLRVEDLVVETVVSLLNLGGRKAGLAPGTEDEVDPNQVALAIEAVRALLPLVEDLLGENAGQLKEAVAQLQMAYVQQTGGPVPGAAADEKPADKAPEPPSRLWVPGQ
jgi:hypothetical protein